MRLDRTIYFECVRARPFGGALTQQQVDGMNAILDEWEGHADPASADIRWLGYMLATTFHETAATMWPITEYGSQHYLEGKEYYPYIGRGFVQLTWETNYARATRELGLFGDSDLVAHPDKALELPIAAAILYRGMIEGWFTAKYLAQYFSSTRDDPVNARQIINGNDRDTLVAGYHADFLAALTAAQEVEQVAPGTDTVDIAITTQGRVTVSVSLDGETILVAGG